MRLAVLILAALLALAAPAGSHPGAARCIPDDADCDGYADANDNCVGTRNADQVNTDQQWTATEPAAADGSTKPMRSGDRFGDACEAVNADADSDADGIADTADNCRLIRNPDQLDADGDGRGEAPDGTTLCPAADLDQDARIDEDDNCPPIQGGRPRDSANPDQADNDQDRRGDLCDYNDDNDDHLDADDNCPFSSNPEQSDKDGDGIGTACDDPEFAAQPAGPPASGDRTAPVVRVRSASRRAADDARGGLVTAVTCSESCGLRATLRISARDARRLRLPREVAVADGLLGAQGRTWLIFSFRRNAATRLRGRRATLEVRAVDESGNATVIRRTIRLVSRV